MFHHVFLSNRDCILAFFDKEHYQRHNSNSLPIQIEYMALLL